MKTMLKRSMAILLILLMVISVLPMSAMAATYPSWMDSIITSSSSTSNTNYKYPLTLGVSTSKSVTLKGYKITSSGVASKMSTVSNSKSNPLLWTDDLLESFGSTGFAPDTPIDDDFMEKIISSTVEDTTNTSSTATKIEYYWNVHSNFSNGVADYKEIQDFDDVIEVVLDIYKKSDNTYITSKTVYIKNPFGLQEYNIAFDVRKTDSYSKKSTVAGSFKSASASAPEVIMATATANATTGDYVDFELINCDVTITQGKALKWAVTDFKKAALDDSDAYEKRAKEIKKSKGADEVWYAIITVQPKSESVKFNHHVENNAEMAKIAVYQPVIQNDTTVLKIGGVKVLELDSNGSVKQVNPEGVYDVSSTTAFTPSFEIPVENNTDLATTEYIINKATVDANGYCAIVGYNPGAQKVTYYPELNGPATQKITFTIVKANNPSASSNITFALTIKFKSTAIATNYALNNTTEYDVAINSSHELNLGALITDFSKFSETQKAQFTFEIDEIEDGYGRYTVDKSGLDDTAAFEKATSSKPYTNKNTSYYLDDYTIKYSPAAVHSSVPGYTITLHNSADSENQYYTFVIKYNVVEGATPSLKSNPSTVYVAPNKNSNALKLTNYINNYESTQRLTYKVTNVSTRYGTYYNDSNSIMSAGYEASVTSSTSFTYTGGNTSSGNSYDNLKVEVFNNGVSIGTLTFTHGVKTTLDCYTKDEFESDYPDNNAFGVYLANTASGTYRFDREDFINGKYDLSDSDYSDYYIDVTADPIGGTLSGLDNYGTIDVSDLSSLKYTRGGKTDTGIDCFDFTLYSGKGSSAGKFTMWIVPNESWLESNNGFTEAEFKASYGQKNAFGVYASSSGVTFQANDFTNGTYKLNEDYSDAYIEIVDLPTIGTLKSGSSTLEEEDRVAVADLGKLKFSWEDYESSNIDCFTFDVYKTKSGSTKSVSNRFTMWIVGNKALVSEVSENWSATGTTMPIYKVTDVAVSDNIASVTLNDAWVTEALETVKTGSDVTIAVTPKSEAKGLKLTVDKSLFTLSNAAKISYITLSEGTTGASISVSVSDILSAGGSGKDFTVTLNKLTISTANDIVTNALVASTATAARSVAFTAGSANITFDNVGAAILSIPYTNSSSYDDEMVVIYDYSGGNTPLVSSEFTGRYAMADISKGGQYLVAVNSISFSDVSANWAWTRGYIPSLAARGTISGMGGQNAGKYMPDGKLTRAEFIKLLVVSLGLEDNSATNPFSDMSDHWAKQVVAAAVKHNIINSGTTFSPDEAITRRDMALYAYRAAQAAGLTLSSSGSTTTFKDENEITGDYLTAVKAMQAAGIINGMGGQYEGYYLPMNNTDRAAAAKIIWFLNAELYGWDTTGKY